MAVAVAAQLETTTAGTAMVTVVVALKTGEGREQKRGGQTAATAN